MTRSITIALLALLSLISTVSAQSVQRRTLGVNFRDGVPALSFSARDLITNDIRQKLTRGTRQLMVMRVYAYLQSRERPIAITQTSCEVTYDVWEEEFRVQKADAANETTVRVATLEQVIDRCLVVHDLRVGQPADWRAFQGRQVSFAAILEFNPMSRATVRRVRQWLSHPGGGRLEGEAFFGSFVSIFINRNIGDAERTLRFESQTVLVP